MIYLKHLSPGYWHVWIEEWTTHSLFIDDYESDSAAYIGHFFVAAANVHNNLLYRLYKLVYGRCP